MSHEEAPIARLLATHCCLCNRVLADAVSVERGIGPVCAKRSGANTPDREADWFQVAIVADGTDVAASLTKAIETQDARRAANILLHAIGADTQHSRVPHLIAAIDALGFHKLAIRVAEALRIVVTVTTEGERLVVEVSQFVSTFVDALKTIPGRRWDVPRQVNTVPVSQRKALWTAINATLPTGSIVVGTRVSVIERKRMAA